MEASRYQVLYHVAIEDILVIGGEVMIGKFRRAIGPPAPAWMDTVESIDAAAIYIRARLGPLMDRTGGSVVGCLVGAENTAIEDRSTGVVYHWFGSPQKPGSVVTQSSMCNSNGKPDHQWDMRLRILRAVDISEVRAMAAKWGGSTPLVLRAGFWYEVHCD